MADGVTVRLANVITLPEHRGRGHGTLLVRDVIELGRSIDADRVDLSATPDGQRIYEKAGFSLTKAPRMKLVLSRQDHSFAQASARQDFTISGSGRLRYALWAQPVVKVRGVVSDSLRSVRVHRDT